MTRTSAKELASCFSGAPVAAAWEKMSSMVGSCTSKAEEKISLLFRLRLLLLSAFRLLEMEDCDARHS